MPRLAALVSVVGGVLTVAHKLTGNPLRHSLLKYATGPAYHAKVAFIENFHADFGRVVEAIIGDRRVYVFIDDLDRCDPPKAADLLQALHLMIPDGSDQHTFPIAYILGMDRNYVAAALTAKYKDLLPYMDADSTDNTDDANDVNNTDDTIPDKHREKLPDLQYGHSFLKKLIQLPLPLPRPDESRLSGFVEGTFAHAYGPVALASTLVHDSIEAIASGQGTPANVTAAKDGRETPATWCCFLQDPRERLKELLPIVAPSLGFNPRNMKAFEHLLRLHTRIWFEVGRRTPHGTMLREITLEQLAKYVCIRLEWPQLLTYMQSHRVEFRHLVECAEIAEGTRTADPVASQVAGGSGTAHVEPQRRPKDISEANRSALIDFCNRSDVLRKLILQGTADPGEFERFSLRPVRLRLLMSTFPTPDSGPASSIPDDLLDAIGNSDRFDAPPTATPDSADYWKRVPAGALLRGAQCQDEHGRGYDPDAERREGPVRYVDLKEFEIGMFPVTVHEFKRFLAAESESDPDREAPPVGGDGSGTAFGAGNVGGYNTFWIDRGTRTANCRLQTAPTSSPDRGAAWRP
ncbi:MAG: SUMF1/EgtB/PvdO family nonheme iron enzyme [Planctomycetes bacterium]|nr:SUMF1/EgtB/PvdO family nonheme iron enzyme [Planctomycetota bacterium]